jgi:hypothetical protein
VVAHWGFYDPHRQALLSHLHHEEPLSGNTERDLFPNLAVFGRGFEFDYLPCLRLHLHAVGERIHRHHGCQHRPCHLSRGTACTGSLRLTGLDIDERLRGDLHLDYLAIPIRNVPGLFGAFDMHHSCAQRLSGFP